MFGGVFISHNLVTVDSSNAFNLYNSKLIFCDNGDVKLTHFSSINKRLKNGLEPLNSFRSKNADFKKVNDNKVIQKQSLSHTRRDIELYINHNLNKFNSFITLTFRDEITDISIANKKFQIFINSWRRIKGNDFYYIGVPEYQKNGRVHYHILTSLVCGVDIDKKINKRVKSDGKFINLKYYDIRFWSYGFSSALDIKKEVDDKFNVCAYLCKYLYKDFDNRLWSHKKILKSNNLFKPTTYFLNLDMQDILFFNVYLQEKGLEIHSYAIDSDKNFIPSHNSYVSSSVNINDFSNLLNKFKDKIVFTE